MLGINHNFFEFSEPRFTDIRQPNFSDGHNVIFDTDAFRMYTFKIKRCAKTRSHDWTECPFAHRGEKARRRDPRKFNYMAIACPEFRTGECKKGELCEFAHGVFEFWLHPARYRTRLCNAGRFCQRKVCFFAHAPEQLRPETKYKCHYTYRARMERSSGGERIADNSNSGKKMIASLPASSTRNENPLGKTWEFIETLRGLKIGNGNEGERNFGWDVSAPDLPNIDWVSELVK